MKEDLVIKHNGKKKFVSYAQTIYGVIGVDEYRMFIFNTEMFKEFPEVEEAYNKMLEIVEKIHRGND